MMANLIVMTIGATLFTIMVVLISTLSFSEAKYKTWKSFTWVGYWALVLWLCTADVAMWYIVSKLAN